MFVTEHMCFFFFFNDTATTEIYTLSLHDALPIYSGSPTLVYNTGGTGGNEWLTGSSVGNGVPKNVTVQAGAGTVNMPSTDRSVPGNLTITSGTLAMNGGDLTVAGNWTNTGTFVANGRTVTM